jgi:hypothetical protein
VLGLGGILNGLISPQSQQKLPLFHHHQQNGQHYLGVGFFKNFLEIFIYSETNVNDHFLTFFCCSPSINDDHPTCPDKFAINAQWQWFFGVCTATWNEWPTTTITSSFDGFVPEWKRSNSAQPITIIIWPPFDPCTTAAAAEKTTAIYTIIIVLPTPTAERYGWECGCHFFHALSRPQSSIGSKYQSINKYFIIIF